MKMKFKIGDAVYVHGVVDEIRNDTVIIRNSGGYFGTASEEIIKTIRVTDACERQEPRVMTLEEAKSAYVVEYRSGKMREVGSAFLDLNVDPLNAGYGKIYRVWSSRPTEEQREAVKWG